MRMLRTIRLDASDDHAFAHAAKSDECAVPGSFAFTLMDEDPARLSGKRRQAFSNGFLGLSSFGRATFVTVADCQAADYEAALDALTEHLLKVYGAPNGHEAREVAAAELAYAASLCDQPVNTLLSVKRDITDDGIEENFSVHDARPLWQRDTRVFTAVADDASTP